MYKRYYFIDALRVIAIIMMFSFHVSMVFVAEWDWHIKNPELSNVLLEVNYWMSTFRMPLLFFVSGYISYLLLDRLNWKMFVYQRFNRLIIPTIIWTFILVAPQIFFQRKLEGVDMNYLEFYKTFLQFKIYPEGNFHWLHLWFIPYLFCYNLFSIPLYLLLKKYSNLSSHLIKLSKRPASLFGFVFIAIIPYTFLSVHYEASYDLINDIARHSFFIFFIIAGLLLFKFQQAIDLLESKRKLFFRLALLSIIFINILRWNGWEPYSIWENWISKPQTYLYIALQNFNTWMWVFMCIGYGKKYLNKGSNILKYANNAVYPFYILHQTVIVVLSFYVVQTNDSATLKYLFILLVSFGIIVSVYHLFIRPYNILRFLFGMKPINPQPALKK